MTLYRYHPNFRHPEAIEIHDLGTLGMLRAWLWTQPSWKQVAIGSGIKFAMMVIIATLVNCLWPLFL